MNLFFRELAANKRSTFIWIISLSALVCVFMLMYPAFSKDVDVSRQIIANLPPGLRKAFELSTQSFFTIYGFFAYLLTFVTLAGSIQAMSLSVSALAKENINKTADFLLTKPISRFKIVSSKLTAVVCLILITNVIFSLVALITAKLTSTDAFSSRTFLLISGVLLLVQLFFVALGFMMSVLIPKIKSAIAVALPTVFAFFITGMLGAIIGNDNVKYLSPFKFYDHNYIIDHNMYELKFLIIEVVFVIIAVLISFVIYIRKDINAGS